MALASRELSQPKQSNLRETSPERRKIWTETAPKTIRKVPVVYYLCRNGHLQHPHFIEVPLSSPNGLYLKDFINRLNSLRGKGAATLYSWSSKRSYKNGYVWQDLFESDFIYPTHGQEYVLKGSELLDASRSQEALALAVSSENPRETPALIDDLDVADGSKRMSDLSEYKVFKGESTASKVTGRAADAATQTDDPSPGRRRSEEDEDPKMELSRGEISPPPPSFSSTETLESTTAKDECSSAVDGEEEARISDRTARNHPSGRIRASAVLRQLISCGSMPGREDEGLSMISRWPRGVPNQVVSKDTERAADMNCLSGRLMERKEADSGRGLLDSRQRSSSFSIARS